MAADPAAPAPTAGTGFVGGIVVSVPERTSDGDADDMAQKALFRDIDATLARLENAVSVERAALDALLARLTAKAA